MTRVLGKFTALFAALAIALGCAFVFAAASSTAPTKAYADTPVTVTLTATDMPLGGKGLSKSDASCMKSRISSKWYRFTTSDRNSSYRISLSDLVQQDFDVFLYDADHRELDRWNTADRLRKTYTDLDPSAVFLVELRRDTNVTARADYKITIKEIVTPPDPIANLKVTSKKVSGKITVSYNRSTYATGYQIWNQRNFGKKKNRSPFYKTTTARKYSYKTDYKGARHPYLVKVRPYRTVNGKRHYGDWSETIEVVVR